VSIADHRAHEASLDAERVPPQDLPAEMSVLGSMLLSAEAVAEVLDVLRSPEDFYRPSHQVVFDAVLDLYNRGEPTDVVAVHAELGRTDRLARAGGAPYLHSLVASVPTAANASYYAGIVAEKAVLRRLIGVGTRIVQLGHAQDGASVDDVVDRASQLVYDVTEKRTGEDYHAIGDLMNPVLSELEAMANSDGRAGVLTGFADLDELTNGLHAGQMIVLAARPSVGKSTLGLDFARTASIKQGHTSVVFSLEMSRSEIVMRMLSAEARVPLNHMRTGRMGDDEWERIVRRMGDIETAPLFIDDSPQVTMMDIRAKCRRLKQRNDLKLVVVDYLQLMSSPKKSESRQQEVSEISRSLKLLAKELEVPVVAISQLNRGSEQRADKRPMMSDLRESGAIEQDADVIILLHREDLYERESPRAGEADLIVAKHRNGMTKDVVVAFQGHYSRFADLHSTH
jgi:replicative DNA helicase